MFSSFLFIFFSVIFFIFPFILSPLIILLILLPHHRCDPWLMLPLTQRTQVRSPVGLVSWLRFFRGFSSTVRQMSGNVGPDIICSSLSKIIFIYLRTARLPDLRCSTRTNLIPSTFRGGDHLPPPFPLLHVCSRHSLSLYPGITSLSVCLFFLFHVCSNANPLHYFALRVTRKAGRWRWVWSIFESRTVWADHITCGMSICIV